jgi:hypothetical protein
MSEGELKKLINFLCVKHNDQMLYTNSFKPTSMWINDVLDSISEQMDEAKKELPKLEFINGIITSNPEWLTITEMKNPAKFIREIFEWQKKWFGEDK